MRPLLCLLLPGATLLLLVLVLLPWRSGACSVEKSGEKDKEFTPLQCNEVAGPFLFFDSECKAVDEPSGADWKLDTPASACVKLTIDGATVPKYDLGEYWCNNYHSTKDDRKYRACRRAKSGGSTMMPIELNARKCTLKRNLCHDCELNGGIKGEVTAAQKDVSIVDGAFVQWDRRMNPKCCNQDDSKCCCLHDEQLCYADQAFHAVEGDQCNKKPLAEVALVKGYDDDQTYDRGLEFAQSGALCKFKYKTYELIDLLSQRIPCSVEQILFIHHGSNKAGQLHPATSVQLFCEDKISLFDKKCYVPTRETPDQTVTHYYCVKRQGLGSFVKAWDENPLAFDDRTCAAQIRDYVSKSKPQQAAMAGKLLKEHGIAIGTVFLKELPKPLREKYLAIKKLKSCVTVSPPPSEVLVYKDKTTDASAEPVIKTASYRIETIEFDPVEALRTQECQNHRFFHMYSCNSNAVLGDDFVIPTRQAANLAALTSKNFYLFASISHVNKPYGNTFTKYTLGCNVEESIAQAQHMGYPVVSFMYRPATVTKQGPSKPTAPDATAASSKDPKLAKVTQQGPSKPTAPGATVAPPQDPKSAKEPSNTPSQSSKAKPLSPL